MRWDSVVDKKRTRRKREEKREEKRGRWLIKRSRGSIKT
jgi:hypothetical protein